MKTNWTFMLVIGISILAVVIGNLILPVSMGRAVTHWNIQGQPDGYSSRASAIYVLPGVILVIGLMLLFLPEIDPMKANINLFRKEYNLFVVFFAVFLFFIYLLTLLYNRGVPLRIDRWIVPAMGIFIFYAGVLLGKAKRNFLIGIRTPWTLSSDTVWTKTHQRGAVVFKAVGLICFLGFLLPEMAFFILIIPLLAGAMYLVVYSYILFRRETKNSSLR